jgi:dolichyl-phosphate-mannose-protein mannosyltransferase
VYLRHDGSNGGYLHSHKSDYQTGSKQQQITCYPFRGNFQTARVLNRFY